MFNNRMLLVEKVKKKDNRILRECFNFAGPKIIYSRQGEQLRVEHINYRRQYFIFSYINSQTFAIIDDGDDNIEIVYETLTSIKSKTQNLRFREFLICKYQYIEQKLDYIFSFFKSTQKNRYNRPHMYSFRLLLNYKNTKLSKGMTNALLRRNIYLKRVDIIHNINQCFVEHNIDDGNKR